MQTTELLDLWRDAIYCMAMVAGPFLIVALMVGLVMSLLQAATQMQENILSLVPKLLSVGLVMMIGGSWLMETLTGFTSKAIGSLVQIGSGGGL
ncbi:MAG: flagellar biosynthetic protein FliQ [Myxococcales bacterium]|nr:flagellar biosynthetic protein FliQ [Myxococcales bacterium]